MLDAIKHNTNGIFFFHEDSALVHMRYACNTVRLPFSWTMPPNSPEL